MTRGKRQTGTKQRNTSQVDALVGRIVVLDTAGPIVYIGTLRSVRPDGFWLDDADVHNCEDGHATKEQYVLESRLDGVRVNRSRVFVLRSAVMSLSALDDVTTD